MKRFFQLLRYVAACAWHKQRGNEDAFYDTIYEAVQELGGVYVKLLQFLSLRADLFPDKAKLRFLTFYDQVPVEEMNVLEKLTPYQREQFKNIETQPFASGTFGQVYRATLNDGAEVVIKAKRTQIPRKLATDFRIIRLLGRLFTLFYYQHLVNVPRLIREFEETTYQELNYSQEVKNALFLYEQYKDHKVLKIPYTYADLSSDDVIVQEYVGGIPITDLLRMRDGGADIKQWLKTEYKTDMYFIMSRLSYDSLWQIFTLDRFYSDPHPGNIKILPNNQYAFIDFGILNDSPVNKLDYFQVIKYLNVGADQLDAKSLSKPLISIGGKYLSKCMELYDKVLSEPDFSLRQKVRERFVEMIEEWRDKYKAIEQDDVENFTQAWIELFMMGEQFNFRMPAGVFAGLRSSVLIKSVTYFMDPSFHAMKVIYKQLMEDIDEKSLVNRDNINTKDISVEEAVETVTDWYESLAEMDLGLYQDISRGLAV